jgi:uncharacterized protein (DUF2141 family)
MKQFLLFVLASISLFSFKNQNGENFSLTVEVNGLQNSKGIVQFALYNKNGTIPDEDYKKCCKILKEKIQNGSSKVIFSNLLIGRYAVNILHEWRNRQRVYFANRRNWVFELSINWIYKPPQFFKSKLHIR